MQKSQLLTLAKQLATDTRFNLPQRKNTGLAGVYSGSLTGQSLDFQDFRPYQPGDDLRQVDWRSYARTDVMQLKLYREEVTPAIDLVLDTSPRLALTPAKEETARFLALLFSQIGQKTGARVTLSLDKRQYSMSDVDSAVISAHFDTATNPLLDQPQHSRLALRLIISDFLFPELDAVFSNLHASAQTLIPIMLLTPQEQDPEISGNWRLQDIENPRKILDLTINSQVIDQYKTRLQRHISQLAVQAKRYSSTLTLITAPTELTLETAKALVSDLIKQHCLTLD